MLRGKLREVHHWCYVRGTQTTEPTRVGVTCITEAEDRNEGVRKYVSIPQRTPFAAPSRVPTRSDAAARLTASCHGDLGLENTLGKAFGYGEMSIL